MAAVPAVLLLWMLTAHRQGGYGHWFAPQQYVLSHIGGELPAASDIRKSDSKNSSYMYPQSSATLFRAPFVRDSGRVRTEGARYRDMYESGSLWGQVRVADLEKNRSRAGKSV